MRTTASSEAPSIAHGTAPVAAGVGTVQTHSLLGSSLNMLLVSQIFSANCDAS